MNTLATYQPKRLKTLNIRIIYKWDKLNAHANQDTIVYPTGLTTISVKCPYITQTLQFDPLKVFDANSDSVTTAKVYIGSWYQQFSSKPCLKVKTLYAKQDQFDRYCAKQLFAKFPNTEYLILNAPLCGPLWLGANQATAMV